VVDDSILMRRMISDMISEAADIEVIDTAKNGLELMEKVNTLKPDVVTLDVEMPKMDGLEVLKTLKEKNINIPVIMLSSVSKKGAEITMKCLELGAFDFISKPSGSISLDIASLQNELIHKIRCAGEKREFIKSKSIKILSKTKIERTKSSGVEKSYGEYKAIVIGASTGGPKALHSLITSLPKDLGVPVFIVQHMPAGFTKAFADRLNNNSRLEVIEAAHMSEITNDKVYIAPGNYHMEISSDNKITLNEEPTLWGVRPAVDKLFVSASKMYGEALISVVLTGMGKDGAKGTEVIKDAGGYTISEHQSTCTIYGMPKAAYDTGKVDEVLPLTDIPSRLLALVKR